MNINVIRLSTNYEDNEFLNLLNAHLASHHVVLKENVIDSPLSVVLIESGGVEGKFKNEVLNKLNEPIYLIATNNANSLAASLEISTFLYQKKIKYTLLVDNEVGRVAEKLVNKILITCAKQEINGSKLGVIGKPSNWLISSDVDYYEVKQKFGIELVDISLDELLDLYEREDLPLIMPNNMTELRIKANGNDDALNDAIRLYSAIKVLIKTYDLKGLTIRCFDVVNLKHVTACLALALLNDEGITCACEGDVPSLLTMYLIKKLLNKQSFMANPSNINLTDNVMMLSHCTIPLTLCTSYKFDTHYETNSSIGIKGELKPQIINICKLTPDLSHFNITIGKIRRNLSLKNHCRTQIEVSLQDRTIEEFINLHQANHVIVIYDNHKQLLSDFFQEFDKK